MIPFNKPPQIGTEQAFVLQAMTQDKLSGDGHFCKLCQSWFETQLPAKKTLMTPSCTHALEMAAMLMDIQPGDEVIMPSYTFVSTANAFALRGATIVFVDIRPDTMNIDETKIEAAITPKTKAIVPVHYAGVGCEMDTIMQIAEQYGLYVVEDAAQGMMSSYKGRALGTIGHLGTFSFHETKNYTSGGEGGLLIVNDDRFIDRAEIIREKGTDRSRFFRGETDKYSWVDVGSSYLPSELQAAYLWAQLQDPETIRKKRLRLWNRYDTHLKALESKGLLRLPYIPAACTHNGHLFYLKTQDRETRNKLLRFLQRNGILAVFHYVPLHQTHAGKIYGRFNGDDRYTSIESDRLIRLPLFFSLTNEEIDTIIDTIHRFFQSRRS